MTQRPLERGDFFDDVSGEMFWLLYQNRHTLPHSIDIFNLEEWAALPGDVRDAVINDHENGQNVIASDYPGHYNWSMFCLLEELSDAGTK